MKRKYKKNECRNYLFMCEKQKIGMSSSYKNHAVLAASF